jgi:hypothetical protein
VRYHQRATGTVPTYVCQREGIANARRICTTVPGATLDERIGALLIATLTPLSIEAALTVTAELQQRAEQADALRAAHVETRPPPRRDRPSPVPGRRPHQPARRRHPRSGLEHRPAQPQ